MACLYSKELEPLAVRTPNKAFSLSVNCYCKILPEGLFNQAQCESLSKNLTASQQGMEEARRCKIDNCLFHTLLYPLSDGSSRCQIFSASASGSISNTILDV